MKSFVRFIGYSCCALALITGSALAQTDGSAKLEVTLLDYTGSSGASHFTVAWVTTSSGTFIKSLRKQGPTWTSSEWRSHCGYWNTNRNGSTVLDGYSSATAANYSGTNSPVILSWNGRDASGNLVADGSYKFWVQYAENSGQGPYTTSGLLWNKGSAGATNTYANQGVNFSNMKVTWIPAPPVLIAPTFTSGAIPTTGTVGVAFSHTCVATGSPTPRFTATGLPAGLTISTNGLISGSPTTAGTYPGAVVATNGVAPNATQSFSIVISPAPASPTITSGTPTSGTVGVSYTFTCTAIGTPTPRFAATGLPGGLSISTNGSISGVPTTAGTFSTTITASNGVPPIATQIVSILVRPAPVAPTFTSAAPPGTGTIGVPYSHTCVATGYPPPVFSASGLPDGLAISTNGLISGTPSAAATFTGTIVASNGVSPNASQGFSIVISLPVTVGNFVGSAVCADCHPDKYALLQQSIHSKMIRTDANLPGVVHGDLRKPNAPATNEIDWALGGWCSEENYVRTVWNGTNWTYTVTRFAWDAIAGTYSSNRPPRNWITECAGCHTTGFDPTSGTWSELNIGCESCHGPGGDHVADGGATIFPVIDLSSENCGQCHIRAESVAAGSFTNRQFGFPIGYVVGQPETLQFIAEPLSSTTSFFPNGVSKRYGQQYLDMNHPGKPPTKHHQQGVVCTDCHDPHSVGILTTYAGTPPAGTSGIAIYENVSHQTNFVAWDGGSLWDPVTHVGIAQADRSDLCKSCHTTMSDHHVHQFNATALAANVTCADCHMPDLIDVNPLTLRGARHPHTFLANKPEDSMAFGATNAPSTCTYRCHQAQGATPQARAAWADTILTHRLSTTLASGRPSMIRVTGTPDYRYDVQVSTDLVTWTSVTTNTAAPLTNATPRWGFEFSDPDAGNSPRRYYKSMQISPAP